MPERKTRMICLYKPELEDLRFREQLMSDPETMSYNHAWGGTIPFPEEKWAEWYDIWIANAGRHRYYRYLMTEEPAEFVGEIAYHLDEQRQIHIADVIILAEYRGRGYGSEGLCLLCKAAKENGIDVLYDDIAADNPAVSLFLKNGFTEEYRTEEVIMLKKQL